MGIRARMKNFLDDLPFGADIYWQLRGKRKPWSAHYELEGLKAVLPQALADLASSRAKRSDLPAETSSSRAKRSNLPAETSSLQASRSDTPAETSSSRAKRSDLPAETSSLQASRSDLPAETSSSRAKRSDTRWAQCLPAETSSSRAKRSDFPTKEPSSLAMPNTQPKKVCLFASLHYWIEESALIGLALAGQGHSVNLAYLPYAEWDKEITPFDLRRQDLYTRAVFAGAKDFLRLTPLADGQYPSDNLPAEVLQAVEQVSDYDTQYTLQVEETDRSCALYRLRYLRNLQAAGALYAWLQAEKPDVLIVPNGTILEMGVAYRVARPLGLRVVTFEFADQRERIWLAQDDEIMSHDTSALWQALGGQNLPETARRAMLNLYAARRNAKLWGNFARQWQQTPLQGAREVRAKLGLDQRPVALLATNVLGDSLTLGRQRISATMADWIVGTLAYYTRHPEAQLLVRVHPGELLTHGTSMVEVINANFPRLPENIHIILPGDKTNTYDLVEIADFGLVYTTTVGMEMAMVGLPVIVAGKTHYAGKGFTLDPQSWEAFEDLLTRVLAAPASFRLSPQQVEQAWLYAYLFFFEFSLPFPWHLLWLADDFSARPLRFVLSPEGQARFAPTFGYLVGEPLDWAARGLARLNELPVETEENA